MKRRCFFDTLLAFIFAFCLLLPSFADDSWTQAWRMERQIPPEPQPDEELIEWSAADLEAQGDYTAILSYDNCMGCTPTAVNPWLRPSRTTPEPWYLVQP